MLRLQVLANRGLHCGVLLSALVCLPNPGIGDALFDSLIACGQITSDTARLTCFDREIAEIRKKNPQPPASVAPTAEQKFGLSNKQVLDLGGDAGPSADADGTACAHRKRVSAGTRLSGRCSKCWTMRRPGNRASSSTLTLPCALVRKSRFSKGARSARSGYPPTLAPRDAGETNSIKHFRPHVSHAT